LNSGGGKEAIGFDEIVSQFEPDDPQGMGGPVIIIEISICIDEGGFHKNKLTSPHTDHSNIIKISTKLYLAIKLFSRLLSNILRNKYGGSNEVGVDKNEI
jgi:hypothetical protein